MAKGKQQKEQKHRKFKCRDCVNSYDYQGDGKYGKIHCRCKLDPKYLKLLNHDDCKFIELKMTIKMDY